MRILCINNYSINRVENEINNDLKPSHHLYGIVELKQNGYTIITLEKKNNFSGKYLNWINKIPLFNVGDIGLQLNVFFLRDQYDIIYAPCQGMTTFLGVLSFLGLFKKKIIMLVHHPFCRGRLGIMRKYSLWPSLRGHTKIGALSTNVAEEINDIVGQQKAICLHWGPDTTYFDKVIDKKPNNSLKKEIDVIAIGRTGRDYQTLIDAFSHTNVRVAIYCSIDEQNILKGDITSNIEINYLDSAESLNYPELIKLYSNAKLFAIPMFFQEGLCGLTSITDALALSMPLLVTKNDYIEIDVEVEKIGYWFAPGDAQAWKDKTIGLLNDRTTLNFMGENARRLAKTKYNNKIFYNELASLIRD